jgi:hypothetical protein
MEKIRSKIIKGPKDGKGITRKFIRIPIEYYDEFEFGEIVRIEKIHKNESAQES